MLATNKLDAIVRELGNFGRYQVRQFALLSLPVVFCAAFSIAYVFTAASVPHRCLVSECGDESSYSPFSPPWLDTAIPTSKDGSPERCLMYEPLLNISDSCQFDNSSEVRCDQWVYGGPEKTIMTAFGLNCPENAWRLTLVGTINSFGRLVGLPLSGYISDRYGRKKALVFTLLGASILGIARSFSPNYETFVTLEFLEASFTGGVYGIVFILGMELVSPEKRVLGGAVIVWSYAFGEAFLGLLAWALRDWQHLLLALYAPALLFVFYIWLIPESVRWLMSRGRLLDARKLIKRAAHTNKVKFSEPVAEELEKWHNAITNEELVETEESKGDPALMALREVAKSRRLLIRLAACSFCWITNTLVFYGLSLNSVSLAGTDDQYLNFILVSLVEAPAYIIAWLAMTRLGRRVSLCSTLMVSGLSCIINPFLPEEAQWAQLPLYLIGKLSITASFDTLYVFTAELFPTRLRTSLMNACSMVGRIGSMLAPQTPLLAYISPYLPLVLFGAVALVASLLALIFPETLGRPLPDSVQEAEDLGRKKKPVTSTSESVPRVVVTSADVQ